MRILEKTAIILSVIAIFGFALIAFLSSVEVKELRRKYENYECKCSPQAVIARMAAPNEQPQELTPPVPIPVVKPGQVLSLSTHQWIMAAQDTGEWQFGDNCLAEADESIRVIKTLSPTEVIVEYQSGRESAGSVCPKNIIAVLDLGEYALTQQHAAALDAKRARIKEAIKGEILK